MVDTFFCEGDATKWGAYGEQGFWNNFSASICVTFGMKVTIQCYRHNFYEREDKNEITFSSISVIWLSIDWEYKDWEVRIKKINDKFFISIDLISDLSAIKIH